MSIILLSGRKFTNQGISDAGENVVSVAPTGTGLATGGTEDTMGPYRVHTFTGSGSLTITNASESGLDLEYLLVGGGGGGAQNGAGGGGGVQMWYTGADRSESGTGFPIKVYNGDVLTITVGGGGTKNATSTSFGFRGGNTSISINSIVVINVIGGGGGEGANESTNLTNRQWLGGCGGGRINSNIAMSMAEVYPKQGYGNGYNVSNTSIGNLLGSTLGGGAYSGPRHPSFTSRPQVSGNPIKTSFGKFFTAFSRGGPLSFNGVYDGSNNTGNGGSSGNGGTANRGSGGSGFAVIRYLTTSTVAVTGVELLMVAGGGAGGYLSGGGAGGLVYYGAETAKTADGPAFSLYVGTYTVVVGAGGTPVAYNNYVTSANGNYSSFWGKPGKIADARPGCGKPPTNRNDYAVDDYNGSGAGNEHSTSNGYSSPSESNLDNPWYSNIPYGTQGYTGGNGVDLYSTPNANTGSGGGGGAGGVGGNGSGTTYSNVIAGNGGPGLQYSISGTATYYAGGGGGGCSRSNAPLATGGVGGGGNAAFTVVAQSGTANTGGGGGGAGSGSYLGGSGGSGIVILRYPDTYAAATSTTGSPTYTNTGGWHIYQFTASGSITFA